MQPSGLAKGEGGKEKKGEMEREKELAECRLVSFGGDGLCSFLSAVSM